MEEKTVGTVLVDVCTQCDGLWFDAHELAKFDEAHEGGEQLLRADAAPVPRSDAQRMCPRCAEETVMLRHFSSVRREIEVDECGGCGGVFLDGGELARYRDEFATQHARDAAAQAAFTETIDSTLGDFRRETEEENARVRRVVHAVRFLCPSYYMPGKQPWGAF